MKLTRERMIIRRQHQGLVMMIMITEHPHRSLVMMMITDPIEAAVECACGTVEALLALSLDR